MPQIPPGLTCVELACGFAHTVVRYSDGSVGGWGYNGFTDWYVPSLPKDGSAAPARIVDASAGDGHSALVYSDGTMAVFGSNSAGQCNVPPLPQPLRYTRAAAGIWHTAALRSDGTAVAFGDNSVGQLNVTALPPGTTYVDLAVGNGNTILIRSDGAAIAFGDNTYGVNNIPALPAGMRYVDVDTRWGTTLLLRSDGNVIAIGDSAYGNLNVPPLVPGLRYTDIAVCGAWNAALRSDGTIAFWGAWQSQSAYWRPLPPLPQGVYYVEIDGADQSLTVARRSDGQIVCQGERGPYFDYIPPLAPGTSYVQVSAHYIGDVVARVGPTSTYVSFASGCAGSRPAARLVPRDTPRIASTHEVTLFDLPHHVAMMLFGWTRLPAPLPLGGHGMPGCTANVSADAVQLVAGQGNQARYLLAIPNVSGLVGLHFFHQAVVLDAASGNALGAVMSDAAEGVIGHW